uniref:F-box domain-containing protein n=1 Tax=Mycena chlorophos TaxID=658473 RepID=A0ABQ0M011_MYCCL|nr:predicted protein [Mycena chlorophos]
MATAFHRDSDGYFTSSILSDHAKVHKILRDFGNAHAAATLDATTVTELKAAIDVAEADVLRYDADISRANEALQRLKKERSLLHRYSAACRGIVRCPIRFLPTELLIKILRLCVDDVPLGSRSIDRSLHSLGRLQWLALSTVCKHWQSVIFGTATLWTSISLQDVPLSKDLVAKMLINRLLQRSGDALLSVAVAMDVHYDADFDDVLPLRRYSVSLLALPVHSRRWRTFLFHFHPQEFQDLHRIHHNLPNLEELHLYFGSPRDPQRWPGHQSWDEEVRMIRDCTLFEDAPSLRRVFVCDMAPVLPWSQIRSFRVYLTPENTEMQNSIALITHLSPSCKFNFVGFEPTKAHWSPGVVFRSEVYSLQAGFYFDDDIAETQSGLGELLSHLELPQLTWLEIHADHAGTLSWDAEAFSSFVATSPLLTTLRLFDTFLTPSQLVAALACTPHLEELAIEDVTTTLLTELSLVHEGKFQVVPALRRLYMQGTFLDVDIQALYGLLHLRSQTPSATPIATNGFKCELSVWLRPENKFMNDFFTEHRELDVTIHLFKDFCQGSL